MCSGHLIVDEICVYCVGSVAELHVETRNLAVTNGNKAHLNVKLWMFDVNILHALSMCKNQC